MNRFKVIYFGTWGYGLAGLRALHESGNVEILKVFTKWDLNKENEYLNGVYKFAKENGYSLINSDKTKLKKQEFEQEIFSAGKADFIVSCCFDRIFTKKILDTPEIMAINVHPSILPAYRGVKPLENAIVKGEKFTGVTIHELIEELDAGDILLQDKSIGINANDTFGELYDKQCEIINKLLKDFFNDPEYHIQQKIEQDISKISFAPRLNLEIQSKDKVKEILAVFSKTLDNQFF